MFSSPFGACRQPHCSCPGSSTPCSLPLLFIFLFALGVLMSAMFSTCKLTYNLHSVQCILVLPIEVRERFPVKTRYNHPPGTLPHPGQHTPSLPGCHNPPTPPSSHLSLLVRSVFSRLSYTWNHPVCTLLCLVFSFDSMCFEDAFVLLYVSIGLLCLRLWSSC